MKNAHSNIYLSKPAIYKSKITPFQLIDSGDNAQYKSLIFGMYDFYQSYKN
jgi:hypothetical protein